MTRQVKRKKEAVFFKFFFYFLPFLFFAFLVYQIYQKRVVILFYFQKNKYQELSLEQKEIEKKLQGNKEVDQNSIEELSQKYRQLIAQYPADPLLFYYLGKLNFVLFEKKIKRSDSALADTFLSNFLEESRITKLSKQGTWQNAVMYLRKALVLKLPPEQSTDIMNRLAYLYLFAEKVHLRVAEDLLERRVVKIEAEPVS